MATDGRGFSRIAPQHGQLVLRRARTTVSLTPTLGKPTVGIPSVGVKKNVLVRAIWPFAAGAVLRCRFRQIRSVSAIPIVRCVQSGRFFLAGAVQAGPRPACRSTRREGEAGAASDLLEPNSSWRSCLGPTRIARPTLVGQSTIKEMLSCCGAMSFNASATHP